jgi:hypothetical protein
MDAVEDYARRWIKREVDQDPKLRVLVKLCKNNQVSSTRSDSPTQKLSVTSQRVLEVLFYVNILQCFFVVENFTANAVSVRKQWEQINF